MRTNNTVFTILVTTIVSAAVLTASNRVAHAQSGTGIGIDTFKPSSSPASLFELVLTPPKKHLDWSAGALVFYSHHPTRRQTVVETTGAVVEDALPVNLRVNADLFVAFGLWEFLEVGLGVPVIVYQDGEGGAPGGSAQSTSLGDPRVEVKARLLELGPMGGGLGVVATGPLGHYMSSGDDLLGYKLPTVEPKILADLDLGPVIAAVNVGFLVRPGGNLGGGQYRQKHALTWNAGAAWDPMDFDEPGGLRLAVELNGEAGIRFSTLVEVPMEAVLGAKYRMNNDVILTLGGASGISTAVGTPAFRVFAGVSYDSVTRSCPAGPEDMDGFEDGDSCIDPDNDQDGLLDEVDECPDDAEDFDEFQDDDGCPDRDNDSDGVPDALDICPMIPEDKDAYEDEDGCPEEGPGKATVKITDTQLLLSSKVYFDYNRASVKEVSHPILDAVVEALEANPHIRKLRVEGHTDNEGTEEYNQKLSEDRAKAVVEYLVSRGVDEERLEFVGHGFTVPKASNDTEEGRAINRRVEFTIMSKE